MFMLIHCITSVYYNYVLLDGEDVETMEGNKDYRKPQEADLVEEKHAVRTCR